MNVRILLWAAVVTVACGCTAIKKIAAQPTIFEIVGTKSQDTTEYWQQEWKLRSTKPVAIKLTCSGKSIVMLPKAAEGMDRYTITMRLGMAGNGVQGLVALTEDSTTKDPGKVVSMNFVLRDFPKGSLRGGTHPATPVSELKVPTTVSLMKLGTDPDPVATLTVVDRDQTASFRTGAR